MTLHDLDPDEFDDDALAVALRAADFKDRAAFAARMNGVLIARLARICQRAWPSSTTEAHELLAIAGDPAVSRSLIADRPRSTAPQQRKTASLLRPSVLLAVVQQLTDDVISGRVVVDNDLRQLDVLRASPRFVVDGVEAANLEILQSALIDLRLAVVERGLGAGLADDAHAGLGDDDAGALLLRLDRLPPSVLLPLLRRLDPDEAHDVVVTLWREGALRPSLIYEQRVTEDERCIDLALSTLRDDPRWSLELLAQHRARRARQELESAVRVLIQSKAPPSSLSALSPDLVDDVVMGLVDAGVLSRDEVDAFFFV